MAEELPAFGLSVVCRDVDASIAFYRCLGVPFTDEMNWRSHHIGIDLAAGGHFDLDSIELTAAYDAACAGPSVVMILRVPSRDAVDDAYRRVVDAGHPGHLEPFDAFWGARYAVVRDPDGNHVGIMSPQDQHLGSAPPI